MNSKFNVHRNDKARGRTKKIHDHAQRMCSIQNLHKAIKKMCEKQTNYDDVCAQWEDEMDEMMSKLYVNSSSSCTPSALCVLCLKCTGTHPMHFAKLSSVNGKLFLFLKPTHALIWLFACESILFFFFLSRQFGEQKIWVRVCIKWWL